MKWALLTTLNNRFLQLELFRLFHWDGHSFGRTTSWQLSGLLALDLCEFGRVAVLAVDGPASSVIAFGRVAVLAVDGPATSSSKASSVIELGR